MHLGEIKKRKARTANIAEVCGVSWMAVHSELSILIALWGTQRGLFL
jgi:hypothetical protein